MKKQSDQTKLRGILKTGWDSSKNVSASKDKKKKKKSMGILLGYRRLQKQGNYM